jgi:hypothetical protein
MGIFGMGSYGSGDRESPKVRTQPAAGSTHATRNNDHGDQKGQEEEEVEVSDLRAGLVLGLAPSPSDFAKRSQRCFEERLDQGPAVSILAA